MSRTPILTPEPVCVTDEVLLCGFALLYEKVVSFHFICPFKSNADSTVGVEGVVGVVTVGVVGTGVVGVGADVDPPPPPPPPPQLSSVRNNVTNKIFCFLVFFIISRFLSKLP